MAFDTDHVDEVLSTTRAVRRRLNLDRPVPDEVILRCIDLAEQAPTGGDQQSRRWIVVRDPALKASIAGAYRAAGGHGLAEVARRLAGTGHPKERVLSSSAHLAERLQDVPVIVIPAIWGVHDGSGRPGLFDSVIQAAWSFCLAARARGLGTAWTTVHLGRASEVAEALGIPDGVTQIVLLPLAYTIGTKFRPAARRPAAEITYFDGWGLTRERPAASGRVLYADGPGVTVELDVAAAPDAVWPIVSDINMSAAFSTEFQGAEWIEEGKTFLGRNEIPGVRTWETTNTIVTAEAPKAFEWHVNDPDAPSARWRFDLEPLDGRRTRLRYSVRVGPGPSGISRMIEADPAREADIVAMRLGMLRTNMQATIEGVRARAEA